MKDALNSSCDKAVDAAKGVAPVYHPELWLNWWAYEHHYTTPGTLKDSIWHRPATCQGRGKSYRVQFRADADFADEQENGFRHRLAHKTIPGKFFMRSAYNQVFVPVWKLKMRENLEKMFAGKVV